MELILDMRDLHRLKAEIPSELFNYLEQEFKDLYEYYSFNQDLEDFILEQNQSMVILQTDDEIESILQDPLEIEFVEKVVKGQLSFYRIGVRNAGEIQIFYCIENNHGHAIVKKLKEICG
ncbi:hypothetical protein H5P36_23530 [Bacillus sp. APMAM]|nr:hypothetical protein [Bacillus sp. APMAM]RTZ53447.1 hypothetical protein EKO25_23300 [Bacillus sp. SAJ1]